MKRSTLATYITAAALAFAVPALAQESRPSGGSGQNGASSGGRPSGGAESTGSAVSRGGSGGGGGGGSEASSRPSGGSSSSSGSTGMSMPGSSFSSVGSARPRAPERRAGDYAVPRGGGNESSFGRPGMSRSSATSPTTSAAIGSVNGNTDVRRAVPAYSRPREGRPIVGDAIDRADAPPSNIVVIPGNPWYGYGCWDCYYGGYPGYAWGPWYGGYGFGLGYFYDPFGYYGYYSPYNYDYGYSGGYGSGRYSYGSNGAVGQLRLKVSPKHGQVYVDGYFAGEVDNFDGTFQRLSIEAGSHKVEIRAEGYETVTFDVMVTPGETVTYKGTLKPIR
jgi:hypothetical protein